MLIFYTSKDLVVALCARCVTLLLLSEDAIQQGLRHSANSGLCLDATTSFYAALVSTSQRHGHTHDFSYTSNPSCDDS